MGEIDRYRIKRELSKARIVFIILCVCCTSTYMGINIQIIFNNLGHTQAVGYMCCVTRRTYTSYFSLFEQLEYTTVYWLTNFEIQSPSLVQKLLTAFLLVAES